MRDFTRILALPTGLLTLLATTSASAEELRWPYNLPRTAKYYPEHGAHIKRDLKVQEQLAWQAPKGMRKMGEDEGEKFFLHYWDFGEEPGSLGEDKLRLGSDGNASIPFSAPLAPHFESARAFPHIPGHSLFARQWGACPADTNACTEINRPDSCCGADEDCIIVDDTGNGDVGCCPEGQSCGGSVSGCDESAGQSSCPNSNNGGCCIEGYECYDVGCVMVNTQTTTILAPTVVVTVGGESPPSTPSSTEGSTLTTTVDVTVTTTINGVTTVSTTGEQTTITITPTTTTVTLSSSTTEDPQTCSESFTSCPASLGGGCCYTGYTCGAASCTEPSTDDGATALPPQRPTTTTSVTTTDDVTTTATPPPNGDACPTGFYMCEAYYLGGCCRVGRNCDTTSCPSLDSTQVVSDGPTVVVASSQSTTTVDGGDNTAAAAAGSQGSCANGWYGCDQDDGGGCCPSGYTCGTASCSATVSGVDPQPKQTPSEASVVGWTWSFGMLGIASAVGMVFL